MTNTPDFDKRTTQLLERHKRGETLSPADRLDLANSQKLTPQVLTGWRAWQARREALKRAQTLPPTIEGE